MSESDSLAKDAIERIERKIGVRLPHEYKEYLLAGLPWTEERSYLKVVGDGNWPGTIEVQRPFHYRTIRHSFKTGFVEEPTIEFMLDVFRERREGDGRIPEDALPVASCATGEIILIFIRGARAGQVWLKEWRKLEEHGVDEPQSGIHYIAKNFSEFLSMLRADE